MLRRSLFMILVLLCVTKGAWAGDLEADLGLLADLVVSGDEEPRKLNKMRTGDAYSDFVHTRLFVNGGNARTAFFLQLVASDTARDPLRIYGAYLQHKILDAHEFYVQAGKIPTPEGTWGPRTYADKNPLVGVPLAYYWQSGLPVDSVPADLDELVGRRDGESTYGTLILYDNCWNDGVSVLGVERGVAYCFSATRGAPGNPVAGTNENDDIALHARLGVQPIPELALSLSWGRGAYLNRSAQDSLAAGQSINDYKQMLWGLSLELTRGYLEFRGEYFRNSYDTPLRDAGLGSWSAYGELKWRFAVGWYAALRYDTLRFEEVETNAGAKAWDTELARWEGGIGYHLNRDFLLKAVLQATDVGSGFGEDTLLPMLQGVVRF